MSSLFILGGARSGKTAYALGRADLLSEAQDLQKIYVATAESRDAEMFARIERHKLERQGNYWETIEAPFELPAIITMNAAPDCVLLIDCLTLWLTNLMLTERDLSAAKANLITAIVEAKGPVILVSNEVGLGIVPENALARKFRDEAGFVNQAVAKATNEVVFIAAGCPLIMKPSTPS